MNDLNNKINEQYKVFLKEKDSVGLDVLRMLKAAIKKKEIDEKKELDEKEIVQVIRSQVKSRQDSIDQFKKANRQELVQKEEQELEILNQFLPQEIEDKKLEELVDQALEQTRAKEPSEMGKVMGLAVKLVAGQAGGARIKEMVLKKLTK